MRQGESRPHALRHAGVSSDTFEKYAGSAVKKSGRRYVAKRTDTFVTSMKVVTDAGVEYRELLGRHTSSKNGRYLNALDAFLADPEHSTKRFAEFRGKSIPLADGTRLRYITDRDTLLRLRDEGKLRFDSSPPSRGVVRR